VAWDCVFVEFKIKLDFVFILCCLFSFKFKCSFLFFGIITGSNNFSKLLIRIEILFLDFFIIVSY
jgi:hypothetical protein